MRYLNNFLHFVLKRPTKEASSIILNSRSNSQCINSTFTASICVCWSNHYYCIAWRSAFTAEENLASGETRRLSIAAPRYATQSPAAQCGPDRRGRPNALASVGFVPGAKARSAPQSRDLASLVRVTWCFDAQRWPRRGDSRNYVPQTGRPQVLGSNCWGLYLDHLYLSQHSQSVSKSYSPAAKYYVLLLVQ